jgi:hypothetical protein
MIEQVLRAVGWVYRNAVASAAIRTGSI